MAVTVCMPKLGLTMSEGRVIKWLCREGEFVEKGRPLLELETDKSTVEHEAPADGVLAKILVGEGETVPCGAAICMLAEEGEDISALTVAEIPASNASSVAAAIPPDQPVATILKEQRAAAVPVLRASPAAKKRARELGVDLAGIAGTGPEGRIVEKDVQAPHSTEMQPVPPAMPGTQARSLPLSPAQRRAADRLTQSKQTVPHWYLKVRVDCGNLAALRDRLRPGIERRYRVKLTYSHLLIKALARALDDNPGCNVRFDEANGQRVAYSQANIGLAVAAGEDLYVPVVRNVGSLTLGEVAVRTSGLTEKARNGRLLPADYEGGTVTISNLGMYDVDWFIPIINPPEGAILGIGSIREQVVARDGQAVVRPVMQLVLSADHRCINGSQGAQLMECLKDLLENPEDILL